MANSPSELLVPGMHSSVARHPTHMPSDHAPLPCVLARPHSCVSEPAAHNTTVDLHLQSCAQRRDHDIGPDTSSMQFLGHMLSKPDPARSMCLEILLLRTEPAIRTREQNPFADQVIQSFDIGVQLGGSQARFARQDLRISRPHDDRPQGIYIRVIRVSYHSSQALLNVAAHGYPAALLRNVASFRW